MELKDLSRIPYIDGVSLLADRPTRRLKKSLAMVRRLGTIEQLGRARHVSKELQEDAKRQLTENRGQLLPLVKALAARGIYGLKVESAERPMVIWWYLASSWQVVDPKRLARGRYYRSSEEARRAVSFTWRGLTEAELDKVAAVLGADRFNEVSVSLKKTDFVAETGAKRPPAGTRVGRETWSVEVVPLWEDEDE